MNAVVLIFGPTGVGKSKLAIELSKELGGEIISADSMQIYKGMDIGTAKVSKEEQSNIKHHLIDIINPNDYFSSFDFRERALKLIKDIQKKGRVPFVVGGTPFYFASLIRGLFDGVGKDSKLRDNLEKIAKEKGKLFLHGKLSEIDKKRADTIHPNDTKRVIRAIEVFEITKNTISEHWENHKQAQNIKSFIKIGLTKDRKLLYRDLDNRCDDMIKRGFINEVKALRKAGYTKELPSMKAIGYRHFLSYLDKYCSLEESIRLFKRDTRRFAKRQWTFLNKIEDTSWFEADEYDIIKELIKTKLQEGLL